VTVGGRRSRTFGGRWTDGRNAIAPLRDGFPVARTNP
jgi:hypothetical protein